MPAALERKLKREAAKDPSIKDKDAYVYGTLRKTGWKPSHQKDKKKKEMRAKDQRVIRLKEINDRLNTLVEFAGNPEDPSAAMFGGADTGAVAQSYKDAEESSALQRLKLKIARLRGMGLYNY